MLDGSAVDAANPADVVKKLEQGEVGVAAVSVKEAVQIAKSYVADVIDDDIIGVRLEEIVPSHGLSTGWDITIGFSRAVALPFTGILGQVTTSSKREYKVIQVRETGEVRSMTIRSLPDQG